MSDETHPTSADQATHRRLWREVLCEHGAIVPLELWGLVKAEDDLRGLHDRETEEADLKGSIEDFVLKKWPSILANIQSQAANPRVSKVKRSGQRTYRKPLAHRLRRLGFIVPRIVPGPNLLRRSLDSGHTRLPRGTWPSLADDWNSAHPADVCSPDDLRVLFWHARRDDHLLRETYFDRLFARWGRYLWHEEEKKGGPHSPGDRLKLMALMADATDEYIREHRERQQRTQSLPPLSEKYRRSKEYNRALSKQQKTRHLPKPKPRARKG